jgi:septum formation protein
MIYLASTSPRRRNILREWGIVFKVIYPDYEENNERDAFLTPRALVKKHALAKGISCLSQIADGKIIGADTLVYCKGKIIGKPKNHEEAFQILNFLQGRWHTVYTGVALLKVKGHRLYEKKVFSEKTKVRLKPLGRRAITNYFKKINPLDKAGAYAIQSKGANIIAEVKGSLSNAIGLPIERVKYEMEEGRRKKEEKF